MPLNSNSSYPRAHNGCLIPVFVVVCLIFLLVGMILASCHLGRVNRRSATSRATADGRLNHLVHSRQRELELQLEQQREQRNASLRQVASPGGHVHLVRADGKEQHEDDNRMSARADMSGRDGAAASLPDSCPEWRYIGGESSCSPGRHPLASVKDSRHKVRFQDPILSPRRRQSLQAVIVDTGCPASPLTPPTDRLHKTRGCTDLKGSGGFQSPSPFSDADHAVLTLSPVDSQVLKQVMARAAPVSGAVVIPGQVELSSVSPRSLNQSASPAVMSNNRG
ncbi:hypothetical protein VTK73DRAFT_9597 [Phialemonium thermophilum]|uniref:Uncharacterized protein n=1 Tax=Phialemonium thermophilum TaxID=223376 RepID=A0ABR3W1H2_9PEZI